MNLSVATVVIMLLFIFYLLPQPLDSGDLPQPAPAEVNGFLQQSERIWPE